MGFDMKIKYGIETVRHANNNGIGSCADIYNHSFFIGSHVFGIRGGVKPLTNIPIEYKIDILRQIWDKLESGLVNDYNEVYVSFSVYILRRLQRRESIHRIIFDDHVIPGLLRVLNNLQTHGIYEMSNDIQNMKRNIILYLVIKNNNKILEQLYKSNPSPEIRRLFNFDEIERERPEILY